MRRMKEERLADGDVCDPLWDSKGVDGRGGLNRESVPNLKGPVCKFFLRKARIEGECPVGSVPQKMQDGSDPCCSGRSHYFLLEWLGNKMSSVYTRSSMHFWPSHEAFADTQIRNQAKFYSLDL